uniref:Splicing factor Cactin C-terminal domain-containing protein n=1 Tax=Ditylenchus dipsaci TaxID=166011 RepID=A0A915EAK8_9BILA
MRGEEQMLKIREEQSREMKEHEKQEFPSQQIPSTSKAVDYAEQMDIKEDVKRTEDLEAEIKMHSTIVLPFGVPDLENLDDEAKEQKWLMLDPNQLEFFTLQMFAEGRYSPRYGNEDQAMPGIEILDQNEDDVKLKRMRVKSTHLTADTLSAQEAQMMEIAQHGMDKDETAFTDEEQLERQSYLWSDKYRPRKPRYFNRVHTGFDWNKYNQTHYDIDNPPPKIVQGYRFNIFYPDLLDESNTPTFKLTECEDPDFAILRFKGGAPYEDIAFKIVNREWEINHKHGYKCQFQNGVMQLWFFFKRLRYRR